MAIIQGTTGADTLDGTEAADNLLGDAGNDTLHGAGGNDRLDGGPGADSMIGGAGNDLYLFNHASDQVVEDAAAGTDTVLAFLSHVLPANVENLLLAGSSGLSGTGNGANNSIKGNIGSNLLSGLGGHDNISGSFGNDTLLGGGGNDTLSGGPGADRLAGGTGNDVYVDGLGRSGSTLRLPGTIVESAGQGTDTLKVRAAPDILTFTFADDSAFTMSRVADPAKPLVGTWFATGLGDAQSAIAITFLSDGTYLLGEDGNSAADPTGQDGMERGTYTWDSATGAFTRATTVNTNGQWGLSHNPPTNIRVDGDSLLLIGPDGLFTLNRAATDGNPLVGGWMASNAGEAGSTVAITFLADGTYLLAEDGNSTADPSGQDGMERGTYTWNSATGAFSSVATVDTNGEWGLSSAGTGVDVGLSHLPASPFTITLAPNVEILDLSSTGALRLNGIGNDLNNKLIGNKGINILDGGAGNDFLAGGAGNDVLVWTRGDRYDGGAGADMIRFGSGKLDLTLVPQAALLSIEKVDLKGDGNNVLTVTSADVLDMSSTDKLVVLGDSGDRVNAAGFSQLSDSGGFHRYKSGAAILLVETDVTVVA